MQSAKCKIDHKIFKLQIANVIKYLKKQETSKINSYFSSLSFHKNNKDIVIVIEHYKFKYYNNMNIQHKIKSYINQN